MPRARNDQQSPTVAIDHAEQPKEATQTPQLPVFLMRLPAVREATGLSTPTIYRRMARGTFPRSCSCDGTITAWSSREISEWIEQQLASRVA